MKKDVFLKIMFQYSNSSRMRTRYQLKVKEVFINGIHYDLHKKMLTRVTLSLWAPFLSTLFPDIPFILSSYLSPI